MKKTNLEKVKEVVISLLHVEPVQHDTMPFIIYHPFFNCPAVPFKVENGNELIDITKEENFKKVCTQYEEIINNREDAISIFMLANTSYLPTFWKYTNKYIGEKDYEKILRIVWQTAEFPNNDTNIRVDEFLTSFKKCNPEFLMDAEEKEMLLNLPDEITIYRGCYSKYKKALSWTLNKEKAIWFSQRFSDTGTVYEATINKTDIFAYFDSDEQEIIPNIDKIKDLKQIL